MSIDDFPLVLREVVSKVEALYPPIILTLRTFYRRGEGVFQVEADLAFRTAPNECLTTLVLYPGADSPVSSDNELAEDYEIRLVRAAESLGLTPEQLQRFKSQHPEWWDA